MALVMSDSTSEARQHTRLRRERSGDGLLPCRQAAAGCFRQSVVVGGLESGTSNAEARPHIEVEHWHWRKREVERMMCQNKSIVLEVSMKFGSCTGCQARALMNYSMYLRHP